MNLFDAIRARRSIKDFTPRPVSREQIEQLLEAAVQAPNHRLTEPWRFYVLGAQARRAYGAALGARKAKRAEDPAAAAEVIRKVEEKHAALPAMLAVSVVLAQDPEVREEDLAATYMAVQNLLLAAPALGLGTHLKTGAIMQDPRARAAVGVPEAERIIAIVELGEPAAQPAAKARKPAPALTTWVP
ncbi:MAG: nitroreductase [Gemmatimonadetes bacterium]|nr:nitroreductase [Gemmatimonadota bacterium]